MTATSVTAKPKCAVTSMVLDASLMFANVEIGRKRFASAFLDSGSSYKMVSAELCSRLVYRPAICRFEGLPPDLFAIDGASVPVWV